MILGNSLSEIERRIFEELSRIDQKICRSCTASDEKSEAVTNNPLLIFRSSNFAIKSRISLIPTFLSSLKKAFANLRVL